MLDTTNTTYEWRDHPTSVLLLPVGATEQHDKHLPIATDSIIVDHFARYLAAELDCAMLPVMQIATSLEHAGFRGSFSLKPETAMQVIRDLAAEAAGQDFRFLVIVNGHGGNYFLGPVCRDINRANGALKIVLAELWDFSDSEIASDSKKHHTGPDFHASESETSMMLAIRPDLVRDARPQANYPDEPVPLRQKDLNMFGIGYFNPSGCIGWSQYASLEKGESLVKSREKGLLRYVRDRIDRLRKCWDYGGKCSG